MTPLEEARKAVAELDEFGRRLPPAHRITFCEDELYKFMRKRGFDIGNGDDEDDGYLLERFGASAGPHCWDGEVRPLRRLGTTEPPVGMVVLRYGYEREHSAFAEFWRRDEF